MNISSHAACASMPAALQDLQSTQINPTSDPDGGGRHSHVHKAHGGRGGQMRDAVMQALQTLGVSMPQPTAGAGTPNPQPAPTVGDDPSGSSTQATISIKQDMRQLMHALFQAVKGEGAVAATPTGAAPTATRGGDFATRLSSLISKVGGGSAPVDLQSAFSKLMADLRQTIALPADAAATDPNVNKQQLTLQAFLTQLQQNLGYGSASIAATGNAISTLA